VGEEGEEGDGRAVVGAMVGLVVDYHPGTLI
jgi:hypothetical protein